MPLCARHEVSEEPAEAASAPLDMWGYAGPLHISHPKLLSKYCRSCRGLGTELGSLGYLDSLGSAQPNTTPEYRRRIINDQVTTITTQANEEPINTKGMDI